MKIDGIDLKMWVFLWGLFFFSLWYAKTKLDEQGDKIDNARDQEGNWIEPENHEEG